MLFPQQSSKIHADEHPTNKMEGIVLIVSTHLKTMLNLEETVCNLLIQWKEMLKFVHTYFVAHIHFGALWLRTTEGSVCLQWFCKSSRKHFKKIISIFNCNFTAILDYALSTVYSL